MKMCSAGSDTPVADESLSPHACFFLLLFMLRGMPFVDIAYLRHCDLHDNVIVYRRKKTGAWLTVRVEAKAMEIIRILKNADGLLPIYFLLFIIRERMSTAIPKRPARF